VTSSPRQALLGWTARLTRRFHPRGTERLLRLLHHPDLRANWAIQAIVPYGKHLRIAIDTSDFIEWSIFFYGCYETGVAEFIQANLSPGGAALDVGANIGCHTLLMAEAVGPAGMVAAYEPHPSSFCRLQENLRRNRLENVVGGQTALSDRVGETTLYGPAGSASRGVASFYRNNVAGAAENFPVPVTTLDREVKRLGMTRLDLIKIDTEGNELRVLRGGRETLRQHRPVVILEYSPRTWAAAGSSLPEASDWLKKIGYRLQPLPGGKGDLSGKISVDLLALPGEALER